MDNEKLYDVYWEGPFEWEKREDNLKEHHVLYQIYGSHHLYGRDVLLYIGLTSRDMKERLREHKEWINDEYDKVTIRFGSLGEFTTWRDWDTDESYVKPDSNAVERIEALLIYAHYPVYNERNKSQAEKARGIRIFNSGRLGQLFPEISYRYFLGD